KFTEKGKIELSVEGQPDNNSKQLNLTLEIKDTGIGIDPDQQKRIFEAFGQHKHQDSSQYGGTGLGLTISKRLVAMMNGSISLESEPGKGSCFTVLLNVIEIAETQNKDIMIMAKSENTVEFDPSTLLVVDDHDTNRTLIKEYLKSTNLKVIEACNGKEAIDVIRKSNIDLVLMDLKMPVMDGYETIEIIKKDEDICHLPVIAASATIMAHNEAAVFEAGFDKFLKKPVSKADLIDSLANYLPHKKIDVPRQEEEKSKDESYRFKAKNLTPEVKSK
ncbi:MAG: response regulator, partial [Proteobacteria bacterium]|nr:response regulator [Pseudomonadota bacterium]